MEIIITKEPNTYSFTGNPVMFEVSADSNEPVGVEISFDGKLYSTTYYPFMISENSYKISMNLSDYLHFENKEDIPEDEIISVISGFAQAYQVKIGDNYIFNGFALRGGISNQAFRKLDEKGYNIFTYRLTSLFDQFLFTTRTNGKEIRIKETELFPFVFRHLGVPIVFRSESGNEITTPAQVAGTFCAMNISSVLEQMPEGTKRIEIWRNGEYVFHFSVLPGKMSEEKYLLRFKNSLGAFEVLEVTGKAMYAPEFSEETLWQTLTELNFYEERRSRVKSRGAIDVETGYKERSEFSFILDMIQSNEIYFIYPDGDSFRCHVKADSAQFRHLMTDPTSIKLNIRAVTDEEFATPAIEFSDDIIPPIEFVSKFIFKVNVKPTDVGNELNICNLGTSDGVGYANCDWGDGTIEQKQIQQSQIQNIDDPATGEQMAIVYGNYLKHTYTQTGEFTVTINTTKRVNGFRFAPLPISGNNEWYTTGQMNNFVTQIIKTQSDYILNASRMFSGVRYGWFADDFVFECQNITKWDYMFEFFGVDDYSMYNYPPLTWDLRFPKNFWSLIADKTRITSATRVFNGSGFLKVTRDMLRCSTALTTALETFRGMPYLGNQWSERTGATANGSPIVSEFIEKDLFWDNPKISRYNGCFWFINDSYGLYPDSGYAVPLPIRADLFKYNTAQDIDLRWMFRQSNRAIVEIDLFRYIKDRLKYIDGIFWGSFNYGGQVRIASYQWLFPNWGGDANWRQSEFNLDYRGISDLNKLFPDSSYPNLESATCAFGWRFNSEATGGSVSGKRAITNGVHHILSQPYAQGTFGSIWRENDFDTGVLQAEQLDIAAFLAKFPKCTATSGINPHTNVVDGHTDAWAYNFWDFDVQDGNGNSRMENFSAYNARPAIKEPADMISWGWGVSV